MKKSFLKRVAAAVVAVPVALTQTALFTSFAAGETTGTKASKTYTLDDLMAINATRDLVEKEKFVSKADTRFAPKELNSTYAYVQTSNWNQLVSGLLYNKTGTTIDLTDKKEEIVAAIKKEGAVYDILKDAIKDKNSKIIGEIDGTDVTVTISFDYNYGNDVAEFANEQITKKINAKYADKDTGWNGIESDKLRALKNVEGKIVLNADASKLASKNTAEFSATVTLGGKEKKGVKEVEEYVTDTFNEAIKALQDDAFASIKKVVDDRNATIDDFQKQKDEKQAELNKAVAKINGVNDQKAEWEKTAKALEEAEAELNKIRNDMDVEASELEKKITDINKKKKALEDATRKLAEADEATKKAQATLDSYQKKLDQARKDLVDAKKFGDDTVAAAVKSLNKRFNKWLNKFDGVNKDGQYTVTGAANANELLAKLDKKYKRLPASVESFEKSRYYRAFKSAFTTAVELLNQNAAENIAISAEDVMTAVKSAYNMDAYVKGSTTSYTASGETLFYVPDVLTEADKATIIESLNNKKELVVANKEVNPATLTTVKVVEAKFDDGKAGTEFSGSAAMEIYRVVTFDVKDKGVTTTTTTTTTSTTSTTTTSATTSTTSTSSDTTTTSTTVTSDTTATSSSSNTTDTTVSSSTDTTATTVTSNTTDTTSTSTSDTKPTTTTSTTTSTTASTTTSTTTNTTTSESTTETTTSTTTSTTKETPAETRNTKYANEIEINVTVKTTPVAGAGFYYAHDEIAFDTDKLFDKPDTCDMTPDGKVDKTQFTLGTKDGSKGAAFSASDLWNVYNNEEKDLSTPYVVEDLYIYYNLNGDLCTVVDANRKPITVKVYVGVKGDLNQDGKCNAADGTRALVHAAQVGNQGVENSKLTAFDDVKAPALATDADIFEKFVVFLGDTNTESSDGEKPEDNVSVNSADGTAILVYAAKFGNSEIHDPSYLWNQMFKEEDMPAYSGLVIKDYLTKHPAE